MSGETGAKPGRDLKADNSDDAPIPGPFDLVVGGEAYSAKSGARGVSFTRDGQSVSEIWVVGKSEGGESVLFQLHRTKGPGDGTTETTEVVDYWPVDDVVREQRGMDAEPEPVATLRGDELGEWADMLSLQKKAQGWYRANLQGKTATNEETGWSIRFTRDGGEKVRGKPLDYLLRAVPALEQIVTKATLISTEPDRRGRPHVKAVHRMSAVVSVAGRTEVVYVAIREMDDGRKFYDMNLWRSVGARDAPRDARESRVEPDTEVSADPLNLSIVNDAVKGSSTNADAASITPAQAKAINAAARKALGAAGLLDKIGFRVRGGRLVGPNGTYAGGIISILRDRGKGWRHTLDHEIIHALRDSARWGGSHGLFKAGEWRVLVVAARANANIRARVEANYGDLDAAAQAEEMVAELYADWARSRQAPPAGPLGRAFETIRSFFRAAAAALRGEGFVDAARAMQHIADGTIGRRGPDGGGRQRSALDRTDTQAREQRDMPDMPDDRAERSIARKILNMAMANGRETGGDARQMVRDAGRFTRALPGEARKRATREGLSNALTDAMAGGSGGQWSILGLVPGPALFMELGRDLEASRTYLDEKDAMDTLRNEWQARANTTAVEWRKLLGDEKANSTLMDTMHEATLQQVDPTRPFEPRASDWHHAMVDDPAVDENLRRNARALIAQDQRRKAIWERLRADLDRLPPAYRQMFETVRDEYAAMADAIEEAVVENVEKSMKAAVRKAQDAYDKRMKEIRDEGLTGQEKADAEQEAKDALTRTKARAAFQSRAKVAGLRRKFESNRLEGPYFPLTRHRDYFVTLRDDDGRVVSFSLFENRRAQKEWAKEAKAQGHHVEVGVMSNAKDLRGAVDAGFVAEVERILSDANVDGLVMDQVWQHFLNTLPDLSMRKNRIHRKGRAGFNRDAFRGFGRQMFHGAHQFARLKHGINMSEALAQMEKEVPKAKDPVRAGLVLNEMNRRHEFTMNPTSHAWTQYASSGAFVWFLGMTPAAAVVNLSQTTVIGVPMLGAAFKRQGIKGAASEISRAMGDFTRGGGRAQKSARLTDQERAAMQEAYDLGLVEKRQAHDLAGVGETGVQYSDARALDGEGSPGGPLRVGVPHRPMMKMTIPTPFSVRVRGAGRLRVRRRLPAMKEVAARWRLLPLRQRGGAAQDRNLSRSDDGRPDNRRIVGWFGG